LSAKHAWAQKAGALLAPQKRCSIQEKAAPDGVKTFGGERGIVCIKTKRLKLELNFDPPSLEVHGSGGWMFLLEDPGRERPSRAGRVSPGSGRSTAYNSPAGMTGSGPRTAVIAKILTR